MLGVMEYGVGVIRRSMGSLVWLMGIVGMNFGTSQRASKSILRNRKTPYL